MHNIKPDFFFQKNSFPVCLAPMVGLSHAILREVIKNYMPQAAVTIWPTEMLNSRRIPHEVLGKTSETYVSSHEMHLVPQILGNEQEAIQKSVIKLHQHWNLSGIDINMGCPVQKALKHNYGVSLMGDVDYAAEVVRYAVSAAERIEDQYLPVSVKLRAVDSEKNSEELIRFVEKLEQAGAAWITLHPRTASQKRRGTADWEQITFLKKNMGIPIIGNGDIQTVDDVFQMLQQTQADKVMVGRALTARPWLMWQVGERLGLAAPSGRESVKAPQTPEEEGAEYGRMLLRFLQLSEEIFIQKIGLSENLVMRKIQFFVRTNHVWLQFGHELMSLINRSKSILEMKEKVSDFFSKEQILFLRTELRQ